MSLKIPSPKTIFKYPFRIFFKKLARGGRVGCLVVADRSEEGICTDFLTRWSFFVGGFARRRVHACALLSCGVAQKPHGRRKFSGDNARPGCRYRHQRASGISGFLREDVHSAATIHARNLSEFGQSQIRGSAHSVVELLWFRFPCPSLVFFAGSGSPFFPLPPHNLSETDKM